MCNCSGQIGNCNCNDCSLITVPSIQGPPGPQGPQGIQGLPGAVVLHSQPANMANENIGSIERLTPECFINTSQYFNQINDTLNVRVFFRMNNAPGGLGQMPYIYGVGINSSQTIAGQTVALQFGNNIVNTVPQNQHRVFIDLYITRRSVPNLFSVSGNIYVSEYQQLHSGTAVRLNTSNSYIIIGSFTSTIPNGNFYIYPFALDVNGSNDYDVDANDITVIHYRAV